VFDISMAWWWPRLMVTTCQSAELLCIDLHTFWFCPHKEFCFSTVLTTLFLMFCWPCISIHVCNETNLMHYLSSVYWVTIPLHVLDLLLAHHQEVTLYICDNQYVLYVIVDCRHAWMDSQLRCTTRTNCQMYTLIPPDDGQLTSPKHVGV
jgi:hypothetical protein